MISLQDWGGGISGSILLSILGALSILLLVRITKAKTKAKARVRTGAAAEAWGRIRHQFTGLRITRHKGIIFASAFITIAATATTISFMLNNTPESVSAAPDTPELSITPDHLEYSLIVGSSATMNFSSLVTTPMYTGGYSLSAISSSIASGIDLSISGVSLSASTEVVVRDYTGSSYDGHTSNYTLAVTLDQDVPAGKYTITITYEIETEDNEYFMFTIDTRMTNTAFAEGDTPETNPAHFSNTATTFAIPTGGGVSNYDAEYDYNWLIDWGDGVAQVVSGTSNASSLGIPHTYAVPGEYQITITPSGPMTVGWMNAFGFRSNTSGANAQANKDMFKSIDIPLQNNMRTPNSAGRFSQMFYGVRNAVSIPANLFSLINTTGNTMFESMFNSTFHSYAYNNTTATIPAGLFDSIDTSSGVRFISIFNSAFHYHAYRSTVGTIPAGLLDFLDISNNASSLTNTFYHMFSSYASNSTVGTIPAGLLDSLDTSNVTNLNYTFAYMFNDYANRSAVGTIPAGLFDFLDTSRVTIFQSTFASLFYDYANYSPFATIPAGLFDSIDTSRGTNLGNMFRTTFARYNRGSAVGSPIPTGLFGFLDLSNATTLDSIFGGTFANYTTSTTDITTDINDIWGGANFAGKITAQNITALDSGGICQVDLPGSYNGTFCGTFHNMTSLGGSAQTFIDTYLGGITPDFRAYTFSGTQVSDLSSLHANWK